MNILITGGTGTVGSAVVRALEGKAELSVLTRDQGKTANLPKGVKGVVGNMLDVGDVRRVFKGFDAVFLVNTVSPTENTEGLLAINGMRDSGVKRVVYLSVQDADKAVHLPHFGSKVPVEMAAAKSGMTWTVLRPNNFFQNDGWFKQGILEYGVYMQPVGQAGMSRVDVRDIAEVAAAAFLGKADNQTVNVVGPREVTGNDAARLWSEALGREVRYGGDDMDAWEASALSWGMPPTVVYDFRLMYEWFQRHGLKATPKDVELMTRLLGHPPRRYEDYVKEAAAEWGRGK